MSHEEIARALETAADETYKQGELKFLASEAINELLSIKASLAARCRELEKALENERKRREEMAYWLQGKSSKAEQQAIFRLGQKDMQASVVDMLLKAAEPLPPNGMVGPTLRIAADMVKNMEVS